VTTAAPPTSGVRAPEFKRCLAASLAVHGLLFLIARGLPAPSVSPLEVDLTMTGPFLGTGAAKLGAPKQKVEGAKGIPLPAETPLPPKPQPAKPEPPKDWTLPGPGAKIIEKPAPPPPTPGGAEGGTGTSPLVGGQGPGADYGTPNGHGDGGMPLLKRPELLNRDEILANIRKFYPERERRAGHEGDVLLAVHLDTSGTVVASEVKASASPDFDAAAQRVALLMRFSPAIGLAGQPVPVKLGAPIQFRLKDE